MPEPYLPDAYWEQRFSNRLDISAVGDLSLGYAYNTWLYRCRYGAARRALAKLSVDWTDMALLDVGVGSGEWIPFWQASGIADITGVDVTSASVRVLRERHRGLRFVKGDIGAATPPLTGTWDIVTAFDVLFHIVCDESFANAVANLAALTKPGGWVLISDGFCQQPWGPHHHEYYRSRPFYLRSLHQVGLEPMHLEPIFFTMATPLCSDDPRYRPLAWLAKYTRGAVSKLAHRRTLAWANHVFGLVLFSIDTLWGRVSSEGPSLKLLFARKQP